MSGLNAGPARSWIRINSIEPSRCQTPGIPSRKSALHRIVEICDEYEVDWRANSAAKLEAFLEKIEPASRESLFHALVAIDVELRLERGEKPLAQDYCTGSPTAPRRSSGRFKYDGPAALRRTASTAMTRSRFPVGRPSHRS